MTRRERLERRAERLEEWAAKRQADAGAVLESHERYRGDHAFNFQPGHIPERARVIKQAERAFESLDKAAGMAGRAAGIEEQLARSIYSDDVDAVGQLRAKADSLEAERDGWKAANAEWRRTHKAELAAMGPYDRGQSVPYPSYSLQNLGQRIREARQRADRLEREQADRAAGVRRGGRVMAARFASSCADCGTPIEKGSLITYYRSTREAVHVECPA